MQKLAYRSHVNHIKLGSSIGQKPAGAGRSTGSSLWTMASGSSGRVCMCVCEMGNHLPHPRVALQHSSIHKWQGTNDAAQHKSASSTPQGSPQHSSVLVYFADFSLCVHIFPSRSVSVFIEILSNATLFSGIELHPLQIPSSKHTDQNWIFNSSAWNNYWNWISAALFCVSTAESRFWRPRKAVTAWVISACHHFSSEMSEFKPKALIIIKKSYKNQVKLFIFIAYFVGVFLLFEQYCHLLVLFCIYLTL